MYKKGYERTALQLQRYSYDGSKLSLNPHYLPREYPDADKLTRKDVHKICLSVNIAAMSPIDQEEFRSIKYKRLIPRNLKKYSERWIQIIECLSGVRIVRPRPDCVQQLRWFFHFLQEPFDRLIAGKGRKHFMNYNLVFSIGLEFIGYPQYKKYFDLPSGDKCMRKLCLMMEYIFRYNSWPITRLIKKYVPESRCKMLPWRKRYVLSPPEIKTKDSAVLRLQARRRVSHED